jgi:elongation factor G
MNNRDEQIRGLLFCSVESVHDEDRPNLLRELNAVLREDPELRAEVSLRRDTLILCGDDEIDIEEARRRVQARSDRRIGPLQIAFLETIGEVAEAEGKFIRQIGGHGNYGHCRIRVEPNQPGTGYEFVNDIKSGVVPTKYLIPIDQGIQGAMASGILAGFPMVDVKATLVAGSYHEADSNEIAFEFAGSMAFKDAAKKASPVLLEPVMAVEVSVPEASVGTIISDINARRGRIEGIEQAAALPVIRAVVPLAEVLRSSARGRPNCPMRFAAYLPRQRDEPFGDAASTPAKRPSNPSTRSGSAAAEFES